jgi:hypothetical protein
MVISLATEGSRLEVAFVLVTAMWKRGIKQRKFGRLAK